MFDELNKTYSNLDSSITPGGNLSSFEAIASTVANIVVGAAFSISTITLAYAFIQFINSQGDPKAVDKAQHAAMYSVAGMFVSLLVYAIKSVVYKALGAE